MYRRPLLALCLLLLTAPACSSDATSDDPVELADTDVGMTVDTSGADGAAQPDTPAVMPTVFYYEHVKPIVDAKCSHCHNDGGIGPFPLTSYEEISSVAALVSHNVESGLMPPMPAAAGCNIYQHDPRLSPQQIQTVVDWVDQGAAEGDPAAEGTPIEVTVPPAPNFDTVLPMPTGYTPKLRPDDYRCFVVDWPHDTRKFITGFGVEPGEQTVVHHVIAFLATPDVAQLAVDNDAAEQGPGYTCFGGPALGNGINGFSWLAEWVPGSFPTRYPQGTGLSVPAGSKVVIQVHYNTLTSDPIEDLTTVSFETTNQVDREAFVLPWANPNWLGGGMNIPAGDADVTHSFSFDPTGFLNVPGLHIWNVGLHMHLLGTSTRTWIDRADGTDTCLMDIPRWDFNWQGGVQLNAPVELNRGDRLSIECHWDNTMGNQPIVAGQPLTPENRNWGDGSTDEMCLGIYYVTVAN